MRARLTATALLAGIAGCGSAGPSTRASVTTAGARPTHPAASARATGGGAVGTTAPVHLTAIEVGRLPAPVMDAAATSTGHAAVLAGGLDAADVSASEVLVVRTDGRSATVSRKPSLPIATHDATAAFLGSRPYLIGGGSPSKVAILSIGAGPPTPAGSLPGPQADVSAATIGGVAYIVGGWTNTVGLDTIVAWRGSGTGTVIAHLPHSVRNAAVTAAGGRVIIAGGTLDNGATRDIYAFDPATRRVSRIGTLPVPLTHAGAATIGNYAYVVGGRGGLFRSQVDTVLAIDPASGRVTVAGHLPAPLSDASIAAVSGRILVAGGTLDTGTVTDRIYTLVPAR